MDKRIASNLVVGVFAFLGLTLFVWLLFNMGSGQGVFSSNYALWGKFEHVKGLHFGSEVTLNGLRIGTVKQINFSPDNKELNVELSIAKRFQQNIRKDSIAKVVTQGMLGDKFVDISLGDPAQEVLNDGQAIVTMEEKDLFSKSGGLIDELSKKLDKKGEIDEILRNLNRASFSIAAIASEAQKGKGILAEVTRGNSGEKLNRSLTHLENILRKIDEGEGTLGGLMNDPTVYEDVKTIVGGAKRSSVLKYFVNQFKDSGVAPAVEEKKKK